MAAEWREHTVALGALKLRMMRGGAGRPVLVLHHDIGTPDTLPFYAALAARFDVIVPNHPGFGEKSERAAWLRHPRDLAALYQWLLAELGVEGASLVGLGFGGWIAAEMASQAPRAFKKLVLVGAMGLKPEHGVIADQALVSYIDYVRLGFSDQATFDRLFGAEPETSRLEHWDLNREMSFRIAWKPYMYNPTLPHLLGGIATPALVVWGRDDRIVPLECGERYAKALPRARLEIVERAGHFVEMETPDELARLVIAFVSQGDA